MEYALHRGLTLNEKAPASGKNVAGAKSWIEVSKRRHRSLARRSWLIIKSRNFFESMTERQQPTMKSPGQHWN
jgi:hypothetical protein